jgi:hypothetical protein
MIASSQFSNLQLCKLTTWQLGNLATWQFGNLATWQFGNLARNAEHTFNFQNWELSIQFIKTFNWQEIYKSLLIGNIQILATFNFGNFQFNSSKTHTNF